MRKYYFDLRHGDKVSEDEEGMLLPNLEEVQKESLMALAGMATALSVFPSSMAVEVRDEDGSVMRVRVVFEIDRTN